MHISFLKGVIKVLKRVIKRLFLKIIKDSKKVIKRAPKEKLRF